MSRVATQTVLVVDDDARMTETYREYLETGKITVVVAASYAEAVDADIEGIDLLICDGNLGEGPDRDGPAVVELLRAGGYQGPVLFCSGSDLSKAAEALNAETYLKSGLVEMLARARQLLAEADGGERV